MSNLAQDPISKKPPTPLDHSDPNPPFLPADLEYLAQDYSGSFEEFLRFWKYPDPPSADDIREARTHLTELRAEEEEDKRRAEERRSQGLPSWEDMDSDDEEMGYGVIGASSRTCQSYGGYMNFMNSFGLKPWEDDDYDAGFAIMEMMDEVDGATRQHVGTDEDQAPAAAVQTHHTPPSTTSSHSSHVCDSFGGYEDFMHSYVLKPYDSEDRAEGEAIMKAMEDHDREVRASTSNAGRL